MKKAILIILILAVAAIAFADRAEQMKDGQKTKFPGHAPDARKDVSLTVNSQTVDMSNDLSWAVFTPNSSCRYRNMSTATVKGPLKYIPASTWYNRVVNTNSVQTRYTGCVGAVLERH